MRGCPIATKDCRAFAFISNILQPTMLLTEKRLIMRLMKSLELFRFYKET